MKKHSLMIKDNLKGLLLNIGLFLGLSFITAIPMALNFSIIDSTFIGYSLTLILLFIKYKKIIITDLKSFKKDFKKNIKTIIISFVAFILLMYACNYILAKLLHTIAANESLIRDDLLSSPLLMIPYICIIGPIVEELVMKIPYKKCNNILSFILYTFIFAIIHIIGVTDITALYLISYLFLSLSISYSYYKTKNVTISILLHMLNNTITVILVILGGK